MKQRLSIGTMRMKNLEKSIGSKGFRMVGSSWMDENNEKIYVTSNLGRDTYALGLLDPNTGDIEDVFEAEGEMLQPWALLMMGIQSLSFIEILIQSLRDIM